jgi:anthranilate synthase component 1
MLTVYRKLLADTETPINAFQKIGRGASYSYLLESAEGKDKLARYSFLGLNPFLIFQSKGNQVEINYQEKKENYLENPFLSLRRLLASFQTIKVDELPVSGRRSGIFWL